MSPFVFSEFRSRSRWQLLIVLSLALVAGSASALDFDVDSVEDGVDNCVMVANTSQADGDGDGIGDACECGDATGDGNVSTTDARVIQRCIVGEFACPSFCDVTGEGNCNTTDARLIQRLVVGDLQKMDLRCEERPGAKLDATPLSLDFGAVAVGDRGDAAVSVRNIGSTGLRVTGVVATAPFVAVPPVSFDLAAVSPSRGVIVEFVPLSAGPATGTLTILTDSGAPIVISLSGNAIAMAGAGAIEGPDVLEFESISPGGTGDAQASIRNDGTGPLVISSISVSGSEFALANPGPVTPLVLGSGDGISPFVLFSPNPGTEGTRRSGQLVIASDDPDQPTRVVTLSGFVVAAAPAPPVSPIVDVSLDLAPSGIIDAANCGSLSGEIDFSSFGSSMDTFTVSLMDEQGGLVQSSTIAGVDGGGAATFSGLAACGLGDGQVELVVNGFAGGLSVSHLSPSVAVKSTSPLPPPVVVGDVPNFTFDRTVMVCGNTRSDTTVRAVSSGGADSVDVGPGMTSFCVDVPLRPNSENTIRLSAVDQLAPDARPASYAAPVSIFQIDLDNLADADVEVGYLLQDEIEEAVALGLIDPDDPENNHILRFSIQLRIGANPPQTFSTVVKLPITPSPDPTPIPIPAPIFSSPDVPLTWTRPGTSTPSPPRTGGCTRNCTEFFVLPLPPIPPTAMNPNPPTPSPSDPVRPIVVPGAIQIDGLIKTLKEFFRADVRFFNQTDAYTLEDVRVMATTTPGLTPFRAGLGSELSGIDLDGGVDELFLGSVAPAGNASALFLLRGDSIGEHTITISFQGFVNAVGLIDPVPFSETRETLVEVRGPPELGVTVRHPSDPNGPDVLLSEIYPLTVEITNLSDRPALYTTLDLALGGSSQLVDANDQPISSDIRDLGAIQPGETVTSVFRVESLAQGEIIACQGIASESLTLTVDTGPAGTPCLIDNTIPANFQPLPADAPPAVVTTSPSAGASEVPITSTVTALLTPVSACIDPDLWTNEIVVPILPGPGDELVSADLLSQGTFFLEQLDSSGSPVRHIPSALSLNDTIDTTTATLRPGLDSPPSDFFLESETNYRATLVGGQGGVCSASSGAEMTSSYVWTFRTERDCSVVAAPQASLASPIDGAIDRAINQAIEVSLDGSLDGGTLAFDPGDISGSSYGVYENATISGGDIVSGTPIGGTVTLSDRARRLLFVPTAGYTPGATVHVRLTNALMDSCGNALVAPPSGVQLFSFSIAGPDLIAPADPVVNPVPGLTNAASVLISGTAEPGSSVVVASGFAGVVATASSSGLFSASIPLEPNVINGFSVQSSDASGNSSGVVSADSSGTTLVVVSDRISPTLLSTVPSEGATDVDRTAPIVFSFSEPLVAGGIGAGDIVLVPANAGTVLPDGGAGLRFEPNGLLPPGTGIVARVPAGAVRDSAGNALASDVVLNFTTMSLPPTEDPDGDNLTNSQEAALGTDPFVADSDGDGFLDGEEVAAATDPLSNNSRPNGVGVVTQVAPAAGPRGEIVSAVIEGVSLDQIVSISIDGTGVVLTDLGTGTATTRDIELDIDPAAPLGARVISVVTTTGTGKGSFVVGSAPFSATVSWVGPGGGLWTDPNNWSPARVPLATDDVVVVSSGTVTVTGTQQVRKLALFADVSVSSGTLVVLGAAGEAPSAVVEGELALGVASTVTVTGGLTLNGTVSLASTSTSTAQFAHLRFSGSQTVDGTGVIAFGSSAQAVLTGSNFVEPVGAAVVTFGPGITVQGGAGTFGRAGGSVVLQGTLIPNTSGLVRVLGDAFTNQGTVGARSGGSLQMTVLTPNAGNLLIGESGTVILPNGYAQASNGRVIVELGTGILGIMNVTGQAQLDGDLEALALPGFSATAGQRFRFMTFGSRAGSFSSLTGLDLGGGQTLQLDEADPTDLEYVVVGP